MAKFITKVIVLSDSGPAGPSGWSKITKEAEHDKGLVKDPEKLRKLNKKLVHTRDSTKKDTLPDYSDQRGKPEGLVEGPKVGLEKSNQTQEKAPKYEALPFFARVTAKSSRMFFNDFLRIIKSIFPGMLMAVAKPPTYQWSPEDEMAKLDINKIKDSLKVKFPKLAWSNAPDGSEVSELQFPDGSYVELNIGGDAVHLTLTYFIDEEMPEDGATQEE